MAEIETSQGKGSVHEFRSPRRAKLVALVSILTLAVATYLLLYFIADTAESIVDPHSERTHSDSQSSRPYRGPRTIHDPTSVGTTQPEVRRDDISSTVIYGEVTDEGKNAIEGVELTLKAGERNYWTASDREGQFSFSTQSAIGLKAQIHVECRGFISQDISISDFANKIQITLKSVAVNNWIRLEVATADGLAVTDFASVIVLSKSTFPRNVPKNMTFNRSPIHRVHHTIDGKVLLPTHHDVVDIGVYGDHFPTTGVVSVNVVGHGIQDPLVVPIVVSSGGEIFGTVTFRGEGTLPGSLLVAAVPASLADAPYPDFLDRDRTSSISLEEGLSCRKTKIPVEAENSDFRLQGLPPGDLAVYVMDPSGKRRSDVVRIQVQGSDRQGPLSLFVDRGARVTVRVNFNEQPLSMLIHLARWVPRQAQSGGFHVSHSELQLERSYGVPTRDGIAVLDGLPNGKYICAASIDTTLKRNPIFRGFPAMAENIQTLVSNLVSQRFSFIPIVVDDADIEILIDLDLPISKFDTWLRDVGVATAITRLQKNEQFITQVSSSLAGSIDPEIVIKNQPINREITADDLPNYLILREIVVLQGQLSWLRESANELDQWSWNGVGPLAVAIESYDLRKIVRSVLVPGEMP